MLSAIKFCHLHGVIHRDLKPENIIYNSKFDNDIKVIDFGASIQYSKNSMFKESIGTPYYIAPEVLKGMYNKKCDIWSCGVILYILLTGTPPFGGRNHQQIIRNVAKGTYDLKRGELADVSKDAKDLIKQMLTYDQEERITATEALEHPWFSRKKGTTGPDLDKDIL